MVSNLNHQARKRQKHLGEKSIKSIFSLFTVNSTTLFTILFERCSITLFAILFERCSITLFTILFEGAV